MSMKVPPIGGFSTFGVRKLSKNFTNTNFIKPLKKDTVTFGTNARYIKRYSTLPDEIKDILSPSDAIDMFRDMEYIAKGAIKRREVGIGQNSRVYENLWIPGYFILILDDDTEDKNSITIYSKENIGNAIWQDKDDARIQILKCSS